MDREGEGELFFSAAMDATALAHATSSRFIRFSSPQIIGSTSRSSSVARNNGAAPVETLPLPPPAGNGCRTVSTPRAMNHVRSHLEVELPPARSCRLAQLAFRSPCSG
uniref:Uncharacterized protein n=1 Tax=Arundo donax TaxID=35708 RepID=A0A0A9AUC5_ARUDO